MIINAAFDLSRMGTHGLWDDEDERAFHEDLPNLIQDVPEVRSDPERGSKKVCLDSGLERIC